MDVRSFTRKPFIGLEGDHDVKIARPTTGKPRFPFAIEAQPRPFIDACRNRDLNRLLALGAPCTPAILAAIFNHLASALTSITGPTDPEEPLLEDDLSGSVTSGASRGLGARLGTASLAGPTGSHLGDLDLRLKPLEGVRQFDLEVVTQVCAALATPAALGPTAPAATEDVSEEVIEGVRKIPEIAKILETGASPRTLETEAVVGSPLFRIRENRLGLGGFLEALLCRGVAWIAVGMVCERLAAIRLLELRGIGVTRGA
jgi:hypothetical protein